MPLGAQGFFTNGIMGELTTKSQHIGLQSKLDYIVDEKNTFTFGFEYANLRTDKPTAMLNVDLVTRMQSDKYYELSGSLVGFMEKAAERDVVAVFVQYTFQISESLNVTAGLRVNHYSDFSCTVNPRLSLVWRMHENTNIKLLYGDSFWAPTFEELYAVYSAPVGNENLGPEKVQSFEIGISQKITFRINARINTFIMT